MAYTLTTSNGCGGSETRTATLHILGSIEAEFKLAMRSVYFPTDKPATIKTYAGLPPSEQVSLKAVADALKPYFAATPDAHLILAGYADRRGPSNYNQALSERRAELTKRFLIEQGVPEAGIEARGYGSQQNLTSEQVQQLLAENPISIPKIGNCLPRESRPLSSPTIVA